MPQEPQNFAHLTAQERFYVALNRIGMLKDLVLDVVDLHEQTNAYFSSKLFRDLLKEKDHTLRVFSITILNYEIVQVCRLWDKFDPSGFGFPSVAALLAGDEMTPMIKDHLRLRFKDGRPQGPLDGALSGTILSAIASRQGDQVEETGSIKYDNIASNAQRAITGIFEVARSDQLASLRNYRDKNIAHPIHRTRMEQKYPSKFVEKEFPERNNLTFMVNKSVEFMSLITTCVTAEMFDYAAHQTGAQIGSHQFFKNILFVPPPEPEPASWATAPARSPTDPADPPNADIEAPKSLK